MFDIAIGTAVGAFLMWAWYTGTRRHVKVIEEDKQVLQQEKQILFTFMHNLVEAVGEGRGRESLFERIVHEAVVSTGAMSAALFEKSDDENLRCVAIEGLFPPQHKVGANRKKGSTRAGFIEEALQPEIIPVGRGLIGEVARSKQPILIGNATHDPRVFQHEDPSLVIRSMIVAPILFRNELLGVLAVTNRSDGIDFNETDFSLVRSLAEQVGLAIQNCDVLEIQIEKNRLDLDLELASSIQGMLLPREFPLANHLNIAAAYKPARKVGGDLYDIFALPNDRVGIAIADVSGKGVPASLLMAICQCELHTQAQLFDSPAQVLRELNARAGNRLHRDMFITIIYAIVDVANGTITFARAGHELPFLIRRESDGSDGAVHSEGMAIGLAPPEVFDSAISDKEISFEPGDTFLLYTDGVTETLNKDGDEFGGSRLSRLAAEHRDLSSHETIDHVLKALGDFSGNASQLDDITLVAVKHTRS